MHEPVKAASLAPFLIEPAFVERIWGTNDLRPWYDFVTRGNLVGEVWLTGDQCRVLTGDLTGKTVADVFAQHSRSMLGAAAPETVQGASPLLIKVIFAYEKLSVQVHPDDRMAQKYGLPRGKTECWYTLAAEPGAQVAAGLRPGVTLETIEAEVNDETLEQSLEAVPVKAGDLVFVDAGTVHAIWPGSVLLETQQNSDTTYRLFDYGRPRALHVAKALEAIRMHTAAGKIPPTELPDRTVLIDSDYFCVEKIPVQISRSGKSMSRAGDQQAAGLTYLFAASGAGKVKPVEAGKDEAGNFDSVSLPAHGIVAVPASAPDWEVEDTGGLELMRITPHWPRSVA